MSPCNFFETKYQKQNNRETPFKHLETLLKDPYNFQQTPLKGANQGFLLPNGSNCEPPGELGQVFFDVMSSYGLWKDEIM